MLSTAAPAAARRLPAPPGCALQVPGRGLPRQRPGEAAASGRRDTLPSLQRPWQPGPTARAGGVSTPSCSAALAPAAAQVGYKEALAAIFVEAWIFIFISLVGLRGRLIELVPKHIMLATAVGIGLFLSHIGFQQASGGGSAARQRRAPSCAPPAAEHLLRTASRARPDHIAARVCCCCAQAEGIGLITFDPATLVSLGAQLAAAGCMQALR